MNQIIYLLLSLWCCFTLSCTAKISKSFISEIDHIVVTGNKLDEQHWPVGTKGDLVLTKYTLVSFTEENTVHEQRSGIYGPDLFDSIGQFRKGFESISVSIPVEGHLVVAVSLQEDNDPSMLSTFILDPQFLADIVAFTKDTSSRTPGLKPFGLASDP